MDKKLISVSFFGINDSICLELPSELKNQTLIDATNYSYQDLHIASFNDQDYILNSIVEDKRNNHFIYDKEARNDRYGLNLEQQDDFTLEKKIPIALLWRQLHEVASSDKRFIADRLAAYIKYNVINKINKIYDYKSFNDIKNKFILVIAIPDNCSYDEQEALLNAFAGYEVKLIWRSIAAILEHIHIQCKFFKTDSMNVYYAGADDTTVTKYGLEEIQEDNDSILVPVREFPAYENCSLGSKYLETAITHILNSLKAKGLSFDLLPQVLFKVPLNQQYKEKFYEPICTNINGMKTWIKFSFCKNNILNSETYQKILQLYESLKLTRYEYKEDPINVQVYTGAVNNVSKDTIALGAIVYAHRLMCGLATYKDKLRSLLIVTIKNNRYDVVTLIDSNHKADPRFKFTSSEQYFSISKGSKAIELYVSFDPNFNNDKVAEAVSTSCRDLNLDVHKAIAYTFDKPIEEDIQVSVKVEQQVLSGLSSIIITPKIESNVLPKTVVAKFKPDEQRFEDKLPALIMTYPPIEKRKSCPIFKKDDKKDVYYNGYDYAYGYLEYAKAINEFHIQNNLLITLVKNINKDNNYLNFRNLKISLSNLRTICVEPDHSMSQFARFKQYLIQLCYQRSDYFLIKHYIRLCTDKEIKDSIDIIFRGNNIYTAYLIRQIDYYHPKCLNPAYTDEFILSGEQDCSEKLKYFANKILLEGVDKFKNITSTKNISKLEGSKKIVNALKIILLSLRRRSIDRDFMITKNSSIVNSLNLILTIASNVLNKQDYYIISSRHLKNMQYMDKLVKDTLNYIMKKGTNPNIMENIDNLEQLVKDED